MQPKSLCRPRISRCVPDGFLKVKYHHDPLGDTRLACLVGLRSFSFVEKSASRLNGEVRHPATFESSADVIYRCVVRWSHTVGKGSRGPTKVAQIAMLCWRDFMHPV